MADAEAILRNLYVHFPFCRRKCTYCSLYSRVGVSEDDRAEYVRRIAGEISGRFDTIYFGGGSPALCDLRPIFDRLDGAEEFTVELHPHDVRDEKLAELKAGGVNRLSIGVQSLEDKTLAAMGRGYTAIEAFRAVEKARRYFDNVGIDLIIGYPGDASVVAGLDAWGLTHCSVYSLQNERGLENVPDDDFVLDRLSETAAYLESIGLKRYEISNYARPGYECRHNLATWRGEDYLGIGEGAFGRVGLTRTKSGKIYETLTADKDRIERTIFSLRTRYGLDASDFPAWRKILDAFVEEGLLTHENTVYRLTSRGMEVCDTILTELL